MPSPDIHTVIAELAGLYDDLNGRWANDPCATDAYQVYRQKEYRDAYERLKEKNIESIVLKIIADSVSEKVLGRLRGLIADNIRIYEARREDFNGIGFDKLYQLWEDYLFADKRALLLHDRETIADYPYPTERERKLLLEENRRDMNALDNERNEFRRADALWISKNYYQPIYELSRSFAAILDSYFPDEKEKTRQKERPEATPAIKPGAYFDMKLVSAIHNQCNNIQFDNITETDLYSALNLQPVNTILTVKPGERTRMCYLIHKLYEHLKTDNRTAWRDTMLKMLDIREDFYKSKYKEPVSEIPSRKSESFAQRIDRIFEKC